ncbi:PfaD family polyunsaturated fatty acid/polyketide biosynthesis protein [Alkalihalobacillus sp. TS-13]|uniref:PfaD family polyunsaturated fatty acid/polyketide biosynthesis protein n=1 Tax=Alkalihalobacillus sp. TS-13 TaxID=2842455 RepID=UPI001C86AE8E|nr:PfaD family polyunsaturated fatty acid/polyketide biosynthesis protein [Alkalihalobacillus sp. TS-13]
MNSSSLHHIGYWTPREELPAFEAKDIAEQIVNIREPIHIIFNERSGYLGISRGGELSKKPTSYPLLATLPAMYPEWLGDREFLGVHKTRFPYITGEMANGIATTRMVIAMAKAGMIGFFGSAGLSPQHIEQAIEELEAALSEHRLSWGMNLIHSPNEPILEEAIVDLYIRRGVSRVSASAFMGVTPNIVRYACHGLYRDSSGRIRRTNHLFAKISRPEVARQFMSPAPSAPVAALVQQGKLTRQEAELSQFIPLSEDITVEADSGGHTDNRSLTTLFPTIVGLRDELLRTYSYNRSIRIGAAGGIATPGSAAAAFALGAAYIVTGSINQACVESGLSAEGKQALAEADLADVIMAPSADMFEQGVKVQVLKRGTMFSSRGLQLYELYRKYRSLEEIPADQIAKLERDIFKASLQQIWLETEQFFMKRDPSQLERAKNDPKHRMALIFRWYLGNASRWAIQGVTERKMDYQVWCGPSMGAFNAWTANSFLAEPSKRNVVQVALNLMEGAAIIARAQQLRTYGVPVPAKAFHIEPRILSV